MKTNIIKEKLHYSFADNESYYRLRYLCGNCFREVNKDDGICPHCGIKFEEEDDEQI